MWCWDAGIPLRRQKGRNACCGRGRWYVAGRERCESPERPQGPRRSDQDRTVLLMADVRIRRYDWLAVMCSSSITHLFKPWVFPLIGNKNSLSHIKPFLIRSSKASRLFIDGRHHASPSRRRRSCSPGPSCHLGLADGLLERRRWQTRSRPLNLGRGLPRRVSSSPPPSLTH